MDLAISTRWNALRHTSGHRLIEEIVLLGLNCVELGYDLRADLAPGVVEMVRSGIVRVVSLHNFCPLPTSAPRPHPEVYLFTDEDSRSREYAVEHTIRTLRFAAEIGAKVIVAHGGYVSGSRVSRDLIALSEQGQRHAPEYERLLHKGRLARDSRAQKYLSFLSGCLDRLMPVLEETGVTLALEILPAWEALPSELEMETLVRQYGARRVACWYDIGHAQIRDNLGFVNTPRWRERLAPWMAGVHIHDVKKPARDHLMPPQGDIDFSDLKSIAQLPIPLVLEPTPDTPVEHITAAIQHLVNVWAPTPHSSTAE